MCLHWPCPQAIYLVRGFSVDQLKGNIFFPDVLTRCSSCLHFSPEDDLECLAETSVKVVYLKLVYTENPIVPSFWSQLRIAVSNTYPGNT